MARFTNYATLSYNGGTKDSNIVTGELLEVLSATKTAVTNNYTANDDATYVISILNSGATPITAVTVTDNMGGYIFDGTTLYPLTYVDGSLRYYINGVLQPTPVVTPGPPLAISGLAIPSGGNVTLIYEAKISNFAPLGTDAAITNTAVINSDNLAAEITVSSTINMASAVDLNISKAICPATITENGQLTYTFVIENMGNIAATEADMATLTDTFDPKLSNLSVTFNGAAWTEGTQYSYNADTGVFSTTAGQITVPSATYTQNTNGTWTITPGTSTLVITGTV